MIAIIIVERRLFSFIVQQKLCPKYANRKANSGDPDQTAPKEQSDQGLHYLLKSVNVRANN